YGIAYFEYCMTLVQAQIPEGEYRLLRQRAEATGQPMKEIVRQALHAYLADDTVDPNDPIFKIFPLGSSGRKGHSAARDHDVILYGPRRR
ncbi:MAG: CopG family transcriptional regulator, partial [Euryarchaeota archaeon]|nr:CopG family transcriptional regulator [Euryarchaeota archaeon]